MRLNRIVLSALSCVLAGSVLSPIAWANGPEAGPVGEAASEGPHATIVGGEKTTVAEWPFIIAGLREGGSRPRGQSCTASVIAPRVILTAGHCYDDDLPGKKSYVYGLDDFDSGEGFVTEVVDFERPPEYGSWSGGWDGAVVTVADDIPVKDGKFATFATSADSDLTKPGAKGTAVGYGRTYDGDNETSALKKAPIPVVEDSQCSSVGGISYDPETMYCGGGTPQNNICQGDSGGPHVIDGVITGITSWGVSGCQGVAGFAKLTGPLGDWVAEQVQQSEALRAQEVNAQG